MAKKKILEEKDLNVFLGTIEKAVKNVAPEFKNYFTNNEDLNEYRINVTIAKEPVRGLKAEKGDFKLSVLINLDRKREGISHTWNLESEHQILLGDFFNAKESSKYTNILLEAVTNSFNDKGELETFREFGINMNTAGFKKIAGVSFAKGGYRIEKLQGFEAMSKDMSKSELAYLSPDYQHGFLYDLSEDLSDLTLNEDATALVRHYFDKIVSSEKEKITPSSLKYVENIMTHIAHTYKSNEIEEIYLPMLKNDKEIHNRKVLVSLLKFVPEPKVKNENFKNLIDNSQSALNFFNEVTPNVQFISLDSAKFVDVFKVTVKDRQGATKQLDYTNDMKKDVTKLMFNLLTMSEPGIDMKSLSGINSYTMLDLPGQKGLIALEVTKDYSKEKLEGAISFAVSFIERESKNTPFADGFLYHGIKEEKVKDALKQLFFAKSLGEKINEAVDSSIDELEDSNTSFKI